MRLFQLYFLSFLFLKQFEFSNLIQLKYWYMSCSSPECMTSISSCMNCAGERMCKSCVTNSNPDCTTCVNDIFSKEGLEDVNNEQYFICENSDPFQSKVCHFYCRGKYAVSGQCIRFQNLPVCNCSYDSVSTTPKPSVNLNFNGNLKLKIPVSGYEKLFVLRNNDIVRGSHGSTIQIYDSYTGILKRNLTSSYTFPWIFGQLSNGDLVAGYKDNKTILIWDLTILNGEPLKKVFQTNESFWSLTVLKNDDLVIGQDCNCGIVIRDSQNGLIKKNLLGHGPFVNDVIELENGNLISGSTDSTVRFWSPSFSSSHIKTIKHSAPVYSFGILTSGNLASGLNDNNIGDIEIRNIDTGNLIRTLYGHKQRVCYINCLKVFENGDILSASFDGTIKIWDPYNGINKLTFNHNRPIFQLIILPNGNLISATDNDIFIWA